MSSEWDETTLGDFAEINPKRTIGKSAVAPFIEMAALPTFSRDVTTADVVERLFSGGGAKFTNGDTLLARITPCLENGKTALVSCLPPNTNGYGSTEFIVLAPRTVNDKNFLYYLARSDEFRAYAISRMEGTSGRQRVPNIAIAQFSFQCPPEQYRKLIGDFLASLDDRIALLRETNATLEAIAQALFKSWFVDFDPVHAKAQGIAPEGMDEATAALFPDSFEESGQGLVPRGWKVGTLANVAELNPEAWSVRKHPATVAYIDLANVKENEIASVAEYSFEEAPSRARRVLRGGDTIVGTVRPGNRSFAFIHQPTENLTASTGFAVLRPSVIANTEFVYLTATQDSSIEHLAHVADGAAYPSVRPDVVAGITCVLPSEAVMKAFHDVAAPVLGSVAERQQQAQTLATLRDTLLPRLISGQLRLPEAQPQIEEALT